MLASRTTDLPYIDTSENGDGNSYQVIETFDTFGNLIERERQIDALPTSAIDKFTYDVVLRAVIQSVINYKASPSGPGDSVTTDYTYDDKGRLTQTLGPSHDVDIGGTATTVRTASWNVYIEYKVPSTGGTTWAPNQDRSAAGYATGTSPSYSYTLVNPVTLINRDKDGRVLDRITSKRSSGSGALSASDTFSQSDWKSWSHTEYTTQHQLTSTRVYHDIPTSGSGSVGTNYGETSFDYDDLQRVIQTTAPGGTITYTVWTAPQRVKEVWVGTDATGATQSNPAGSGSNNLVKVTANQYDGGSAGGDGNLTQVSQYADGSDTRVTTYTYDFRNRRITMDGEVDVYAEYTYDNRDNLTQTDRKNTTSGGNLIARHHTGFDSQNRVYQQVTYAVDPSTGGVGNALTANTYRDGAGRVIHQIAAGAGKVFTHTAYNGAGWVTATYQGTGTDPWDISNDLIVSQVENTFDDAGNVIRQISYDRLNDTTGNGALTTGTAPKGRASYTDRYPDAIGRSQAVAAYGAVASFSRSDTIPARSDSTLVTSTVYDDAGRPSSVTDPKAIETTTSYDAAGRRTAVVQDAAGLAIEVDYTYTLDNLIETQVAKNGDTGDQTTTYTYGSTLSDSEIARNDLLVSITYPDSVSGSDVVTMTYNRLGQKTTTTDQRGTVHTYAYDKLGRQTDDKITTVGSDTDNAILRISTTYEVRGMVETVTSYDAATSGTAKNQVKYVYNTFAQLATEYQDHSGTVNTGTSPKVQYAYATGASSSNQVRPTTVTYPAGRVITSGYGTSGSLDDTLNRIQSISDGIVTLAYYTYLGAGTVVRLAYLTQPDIMLDLWGGTSGTFNGIDQFGRVVDNRWVNISSNDLDRYTYTYDRNSNRLTKGNSLHSAFDETYTYDNLNRLTAMARGSGGSTATQDWTLDATGNWKAFDTTGAATPDDDQTRTANKVNEITAIGGSTTWATPTYDAAGNMKQILQAGDPTQTWDALYDAWNRLVSVKDGATTIATYTYDGLRRRIKCYDGADTRHYYFNNRWQDLEERLNSSSSADVTYVWGVRYIDELVCRDDTTRRLYALQDANFNVTSLCDTSGAIQERYIYDPYGERLIFDGSWTSRSSSSYAWVIGYEGSQLDTLTDHCDMRHRRSVPILGTWAQRDPLAPSNEIPYYAFESNNPATQTDPYGLMCQPTVAPVPVDPWRKFPGWDSPCDDAEHNGYSRCLASATKWAIGHQIVVGGLCWFAVMDAYMTTCMQVSASGCAPPLVQPDGNAPLIGLAETAATQALQACLGTAFDPWQCTANCFYNQMTTGFCSNVCPIGTGGVYAAIAQCLIGCKSAGPALGECLFGCIAAVGATCGVCIVGAILGCSTSCFSSNRN